MMVLKKMNFGLDGIEKKFFRLRFAHIVLAPAYMLVFISSLNSCMPVTITAIAFYYTALQISVILVTLFMRLIRIERDAAFFFSTAAFFLFFSQDTMEDFGLNEIHAKWYLYGLLWVLFWGCVYATLKKIKLYKLNMALSVSLFLLIGVNAYRIASMPSIYPSSQNISQHNIKDKIHNAQKRSIYHIYLDGFARKDVMKSLYGQNNYFLENELKRLGFYVVEGSNTNYTETVYSISSTLNMDYFENYKEEQGIRYNSDLSRSICNSRALSILKKTGYNTVAFQNGAYYDLEPAVNEYINPLENKWHRNILLYSVYFHVLRRKAIFWPTVLDKQSSFSQSHYARILNMFDYAEYFSTEPGNYYFIHFVCPHPPFVFDENGNYVEDSMKEHNINDGFDYTRGDNKRVDNYRALYSKQAVFVAKRVVALVKNILQKSEVKPIIIIQSDHGPGSHWKRSSFADTDIFERKSIINAYYFPGITLDLSRDFSPVNTYRLLFNSYFEGSYKFLPSRTFFLEGENCDSLPQFIEVDKHNQKVGK
ncbi:MAG: hypothetical protein AB7D37_12280 [Desulfovibrio sp.]